VNGPEAKRKAAAAHLAGVSGPACGVVLVEDIEGPGFFAGDGVDRIDLALGGLIAAGGAAEQYVAGQLRRGREQAAIAFPWLGNLGGPFFLAGFLIQGDKASVQRADIDIAVAYGDTAAGGDVKHLVGHVIEIRLVVPDLFAAVCLHGKHIVVGAYVIDDAVNYYGGSLQSHLDITGLMNPGDLEVLDIVGADLVQRAVAPGIGGAVVLRPVVRVVDGGLARLGGLGATEQGR
jgi:hypothetical protein